MGNPLRAFGQPGRQSLRQSCSKNLLLRAIQIVGHAVEAHHRNHIVVQRKRGAPVAIARLPHGAGIQQVAHAATHRQIEVLLVVLRGVLRLEDIPAVVAAHKAALHMRVAVEFDPCAGHRLQRIDRFTQRLNVDIFIRCRAVHAYQPFAHRDRPLRQVTQPLPAGASTVARASTRRPAVQPD